jgi:hypothetical protein
MNEHWKEATWSSSQFQGRTHSILEGMLRGCLHYDAALEQSLQGEEGERSRWIFFLSTKR